MEVLERELFGEELVIILGLGIMNCKGGVNDLKGLKQVSLINIKRPLT